MRKSTLVGGLAAALASMVLVLPPPASAQMSGSGGTGDIYADLFVVLRDVDGVPMLSPTYYEEGPADVTCVRPISYTPIPGIILDAESCGRTRRLPRSAAGRGFHPDNARRGRHRLPAADDVLHLCVRGRSRTAQPRSYVRRGALEEARRRGSAARWGDEDHARWGRTDHDRRCRDRCLPRSGRHLRGGRRQVPAPPEPTDGRPGAAEPGGLMDTGTIPHWLPGDDGSRHAIG